MLRLSAALISRDTCPFRFSEAERRNLRRFVDRGGMLFVDDHNHVHRWHLPQDRPGGDHRTIGPLTELPRSSDLSAFFKFDGPPTTQPRLNGWGDNLVAQATCFADAAQTGASPCCTAARTTARMELHPESKRFCSVDNTRFAVNLVVYALTA